jgi:hypothetical protein
VSGSTPRLIVAPTLADMARIYALPRAGGPASERFAAYRAIVGDRWGLSAFNPMAGPHAAEAVAALLAIDAERVAEESGVEAMRLCEHDADVTLAVVLASPGLWTDRLATEVEYRTTAERRAGCGLVYQWTREPIDPAAVRREAAAESVRVMWTSHHAPKGHSRSVREILRREGLAYAIGGNTFGDLQTNEARAIAEALDVLADSTAAGDLGSVLYGDPVAVAHGWTPLGIAEHGGFRWAVRTAEDLIRRVGAPAAMGTPSSNL